MFARGRIPCLAAALSVLACGGSGSSRAPTGDTTPSSLPPAARAVDRAIGPFCRTGCKKDADCADGLTCWQGGCTKRCEASADCGPRPEWACEIASDAAGAHGVCTCTPSGPELCDGRDNDCDGEVDDAASCPVEGQVCRSGACACPEGSFCAGACRDLAIDPAHCGACGHACPGAAHARGICGGGSCDLLCDPGTANCDGDWTNGCETAGTCKPELLALVDHVAAMATDGTDVYLATEPDYYAESTPGTLWRIPVAGGAPTALRQATVASMALSGADLFWVEPGETSPQGWGGPIANGQVLRMNKAEAVPVVLARDRQAPSNIAVDGHDVYFADSAEWGMCWAVYPGSLWRADEPPQLVADWQVMVPRGLFVSPTHVYWTDSAAWPQQGLFRASRSCPGALSIEADVDFAAGDASGVYAVTDSPQGDDTRLVHLGPAGGVLREIAQGSYGSFVLDASSIYQASWTGDASTWRSRLLRFAKAGGDPAVLYSGAGVTAFALDARWIYFATRAHSDDAVEQLQRVPR